jgi:hypothetical protein
MSSQVYNLLWISPKFAQAGAEFHEPIPPKTIANMLDIAARNSDTDVKIWVDSKRLSPEQLHWLKETISQSGHGNIEVQDLRSIPEYRQTPLFNSPDNSPNWRFDKHSLIWRVVDAARILASLQGDYDQSFYSDADVTTLKINATEVQNPMSKHGLILSGGISNGFAWYENGVFGFDNTRRDFFRQLYQQTVIDVGQNQENGYGTYIDMINSVLKAKAGIDTREVVFTPHYDGTVALHPGEKNELKPVVVDPTSNSFKPQLPTPLPPSPWDNFVGCSIPAGTNVSLEPQAIGRILDLLNEEKPGNAIPESKPRIKGIEV